MSLFRFLVDTFHLPGFNPAREIWEVKVPTEVKILGWLVARKYCAIWLGCPFGLHGYPLVVICQ